MTMKIWRILLIIISLALGLAACGGGDDAEDAAPGDPSQAARAFMFALLNGNLTECESLATEAVRASMLAQCRQYANAQAATDLTNVSFVVLERDGQQAVVEMRGIYTITASDGTDRVARQEDTPIRLLMRYENDFWRFDDFVD